MLAATSRRRSPSTLWPASIARRRRVVSSSVRSSVLRPGSTCASAHILSAALRPMPWMYVRAISIRLLRGRSTPARRAMPLPLPLLVARVRAQHAHHARATDDFAVFTDRLDRRPHLHVLPRAPRDPAPRQVERRDLDRHLVTRRDAEVPHAQRAGD